MSLAKDAKYLRENMVNFEFSRLSTLGAKDLRENLLSFNFPRNQVTSKSISIFSWKRKSRKENVHGVAAVVTVESGLQNA